MTATYLTLQEVLVLLLSALGMPQAGFGGTMLHGTLAEQAAAYLFHVTQNQAFVDGNKSVGVAADEAPPVAEVIRT